jgi:hypothetical protein
MQTLKSARAKANFFIDNPLSVENRHPSESSSPIKIYFSALIGIGGIIASLLYPRSSMGM